MKTNYQAKAVVERTFSIEFSEKVDEAFLAEFSRHFFPVSQPSELVSHIVFHMVTIGTFFCEGIGYIEIDGERYEHSKSEPLVKVTSVGIQDIEVNIKSQDSSRTDVFYHTYE